MIKWFLAGALPMVLATASCSKECTEASTVISVKAFGPAGERVCAFDAVVIVDGRTVPTLVMPGDPCARGNIAEMRSPSYRVRVTAAGYQTAEVGVQVSTDECDDKSARIVDGPRAGDTGISVQLTP